MKLFVVCLLFTVVTAAVVPGNSLRQRRDVSKVAEGKALPTEYLPPQQEPKVESENPAESGHTAEDSAVLGKDGYEYRTVKRLKYRHRRDVAEVSKTYIPPAEGKAAEPEYLPPVEETAEVKEEAAPKVAEAVEEPSHDSAALGPDGYEYKTVRRLKYRNRREVSEVSQEYVPPAVENVETEYLPPQDDQEQISIKDSATLDKDGYKYKTVKRLKYKQRRDVSEVPKEYVPPAEEKAVESEYLPPAEDAEVKTADIKDESPQDTTVLGQDGYQYKTVRRLKFRNRRDVSEIAAAYLPPTAAVLDDTEVVETPKTHEETAVLAKDGYHYRTVKRLRF